MIFVTVGTHEQQFNRLIEEVDRLKGEDIIKDDVIMQTGFSTYEPKYCKWDKLLSYEEMISNVEKAVIVITHGGPASFIMPLQIGKIPIVVPRQKKFDEHVNDHQLEFCKVVEERLGNIIVLEEMADLEHIITSYETICQDKQCTIDSNNTLFNRQIEQLVNELL